MNCSGARCRYRFAPSNHSMLVCAERCSDSTTGLRSSWYAFSAASTVGSRSMAVASPIASSRASLVPDPMEKCAVCAASPTSATFPATQCSLRTTPKESQPELFPTKPCPSSRPAKTSSQNCIDRSSFSPGLRGTAANSARPARRQVSSSVSTMKVERSPSNG